MLPWSNTIIGIQEYNNHVSKYHGIPKAYVSVYTCIPSLYVYTIICNLVPYIIHMTMRIYDYMIIGYRLKRRGYIELA